ncbi:UvrD-helicase domain-containing protein, partial [bacterium]|nr:UvrD-helicase domain-containing protein [bacterium]
MSFFADFHIHSRHSRATSTQCTLGWLAYWARLKGITVVGTGDFTHPLWLGALNDELEQAANGLYTLRPGAAAGPAVPASCAADVFFIPTAEVSSIYKRGGKVRKNHNMIFAPDIETAGRIHAALDRIGNVRSDGRPILGLDPRDLVEIVLGINPAAFVVPAHVWTPWFSMLGSKSGFDSAEECFGDYVKHIFAIETGLSSDPPMNWRVSGLDRFTLISNSDAHSPENLGRESNVFHCAPGFAPIRAALESRDPAVFGGTIEFFPEEGKYHLDGHRKCACRLEPRETKAHNGLCPVCGTPVVVGVLSRVEELADRPAGERPPRAAEYQSLIGLAGLLGEVLDVGPGSKKVMNEYHRLLARFGPELRILRDAPCDELASFSSPLLGEAVGRMRMGKVHTEGGYDGEYGVIRVFSPGEKERLGDPETLVEGFVGKDERDERDEKDGSDVKRGVYLNSSSDEQRAEMLLHDEAPGLASPAAPAQPSSHPAIQSSSLHPAPFSTLSREQLAAVTHAPSPLVIAAGPGTGKTRVLTHRIAWQVRQGTVRPAGVLAVTFTNSAADEMRVRLAALCGDAAAEMTVCTFHALGLRILRADGEAAGVARDSAVIDECGRDALMDELFAHLPSRERQQLADAISRSKLLPEPDGRIALAFEQYEQALRSRALMDFDDLNVKAVLALRNEDVRNRWRARFAFIAIDEFQDVNHWQYELVRALAPADANITVIGDEHQAVYGFRGASNAYLQQFAREWSPCTMLQLTRNYRSSNMIVSAANDVLAPVGAAGRLTTPNEPGRQIIEYAAATDAAEAEFVAHAIERLVGGTSHFSMDSARVGSDEQGGVGFGDIAVLYRLNAQARQIEQALERLGVPCQTTGAVNPWAFPELADFLRLMQEAAARHGGQPAREIVAHFWEEFNDTLKPGRVKEASAAVLAKARSSTQTVREFIDELTLLSSVDAYDARAERVTLMSMHAAKGREFPVVFLTGCEDGIIPFE